MESSHLAMSEYNRQLLGDKETVFSKSVMHGQFEHIPVEEHKCENACATQIDLEYNLGGKKKTKLYRQGKKEVQKARGLVRVTLVPIRNESHDNQMDD